MWYDDPRFVGENPPPSDDDIDFDMDIYLEDVTWRYPRPQLVRVPNGIQIDWDLIHPSLLDDGTGKEDENSTQSDSGDESIKDNEGTTVDKAEESNAKVYGASKEKGAENDHIKQAKIKQEMLEEESNVVLKDTEADKLKKRPQEEKANDTDSDEPNSSKEKSVKSAETSALNFISKAYSSKSISESDSDDNKHKKSKSRSHRKKSKKSKHKRKVKDSENKQNLKTAEFSVKQENILDEESYSSFSKRTEIAGKEKVLADNDETSKIKISKKKCSNDDSKNKFDDLTKKKCRNTEKKYHDDDSTASDRDSTDDSRDRYYDGDSRDRYYDGDSRNRYDGDSRDRYYDGDSRNRYYADDSRDRYYDEPWNYDSGSRNLEEMKQEPESTACLGLNDYYCDICKLMLNSDSTYNSHMAGKRHKKALRQLAEVEVAKSSLLERKDSQTTPRPPHMERTELFSKKSQLQQACEDDTDNLILGLENVQEIRGYEVTKYYCDLCDAQCFANSIMKHLIGSKHKMNCLKKYCSRRYDKIKDLDRRDRRVERELKLGLMDEISLHGKGTIRVFMDVKRNQRSPEPFNPYQPSTSRQGFDALGKKSDELKVTDEDCLSRDFSDFYCKVCDSHMNNYSMWESHARGKRHLKNKKKVPEGLVTNSNFIEAPHGTISHLEEILEGQADYVDIIVGLNFIRENQGENGDLYNCFLCGSVCPTSDIVDHLYLLKHKVKYLEKLNIDGKPNEIETINKMAISDSQREELINEECRTMLSKYGQGKPVIGITKKIF